MIMKVKIESKAMELQKKNEVHSFVVSYFLQLFFISGLWSCVLISAVLLLRLRIC